MKLSKEIIKHLLPEDDVNTVAIYAGGFKPPTSGHFQVLKQALEEHPDIDELLIYIGKKERDGITQAQSLLIWDVYKNYLPIKVSIVPSSVPPIKAVYNYAKDHPDTKVLWIIGAREGDEDDFSDIANRTKSIDKYDNLALAVTVTQGNVSGTAARNAANISIEKLIPFLPKELNDEERVEVFNIINNNLSEGRKKKKDPKKGTGKKPKGSGRRLYTDEDPKDTVGIKFSTRQDIVDTLNKKSFKAKSHARQSQIINLIHQRVRAALGRTKDPAKKKKLRSGFEYIKKRKEASKKKTQRLKKLKESKPFKKEGTTFKIGQVLTYRGYKEQRDFPVEVVDVKWNEERNEYEYSLMLLRDLSRQKKRGLKMKFQSEEDIKRRLADKQLTRAEFERQATRRKDSFDKPITYKSVGHFQEGKKGFGKSGYRYRSIYKKDGKFYFMQDNPFSPGIRQEFGPYKTKEAAKRKMQSFPPGTSYRDLTEIGIDLSNYSGQVLPGDVLRAPKGFPLGGKKLESSKQLKVIKNSREGVNRYKLSLEDSNGKKYTVRNFEMDGEYKGKKLPKWGLIRKSKKNVDEGDTYEKMAAKGKKAGSLKQGTVRKRLKIPKGKKIPLSLINKEISRMKKMDKDDKKKGVQLGDKNQKYYKALQLAKTLKTTTNLNEVLDPKTFDFKPIMASLTKSMEADGLNLKPYPTVRFVHDEEANADNFFGMTAYYDPNNKEVVLYTLGRHPKDIMRSYAHELIHVHQDNEDRLHDIKTDDVNADKHLENLEREAYETGNIMFRSWTNKVTEGKKKGKDPFGLNAYAYELARLREDENENWYIYLDMDGVVANFDKRFEDLSGMIPQSYVNKYGLDKFWDLIDEKHKVAFWRGIELMPGANKLVNFVSQYPYEMLTAPSVKKQSIIGKSLWVKDKVGTLYPSQPKVTYRPAKLKHTVKPNLTKYDILIDDKKSTIDRWNNAGGTAIFYINANQVIDELKNLGL